VELKNMARERGLTLAGVKDDLIRRLLLHEQEQAAGGDIAYAPRASVPLPTTRFPNGSPMPDIATVSRTDLARELQRRGQLDTASGTKEELYERLAPIVLEAEPDEELDMSALSDAELSEWLVARGAVPPASASRAELEAMATEGGPDNAGVMIAGFTVAELLDERFDPWQLTAEKLKALTRAMRLSSRGAKGALVDRIANMIEAARQDGFPSRPPGVHPDAEAAAREVALQMLPREQATELRSRGYDDRGEEEVVIERLVSVLATQQSVRSCPAQATSFCQHGHPSRVGASHSKQQAHCMMYRTK
jgi:hypothetical protein